MKVPRVALTGMPDVAILADEQPVKNDPDYPAAKAGGAMAASRMVDRFINPRAIEQVRLLVDRTLAGLYRTGKIRALMTRTLGHLKPDEILDALFVIHALPEK